MSNERTDSSRFERFLRENSAGRFLGALAVGATLGAVVELGGASLQSDLVVGISAFILSYLFLKPHKRGRAQT